MTRSAHVLRVAVAAAVGVVVAAVLGGCSQTRALSPAELDGLTFSALASRDINMALGPFTLTGEHAEVYGSPAAYQRAVRSRAAALYAAARPGGSMAAGITHGSPYFDAFREFGRPTYVDSFATPGGYTWVLIFYDDPKRPEVVIRDGLVATWFYQ